MAPVTFKVVYMHVWDSVMAFACLHYTPIIQSKKRKSLGSTGIFTFDATHLPRGELCSSFKMFMKRKGPGDGLKIKTVFPDR